MLQLAVKNLLPPLLVLIACSSFSAEEVSGVVWIDVRTSQEYAGGHVPGAINIPFDAIEKGVRAKGLHLDTSIYLYCQSGGRSEAATGALTRAGFSNAKNIGGIAQARELYGDTKKNALPAAGTR